MPTRLSTSSRVLIGGLLVLLLIGQLVFSSTFLVAQSYAHNGRISHQNEQWKDTHWYYDQANQWFPYSQHWWYSIGVAKKEMKEWPASMEAMEQSLIQAPYFVLGFVRAASLKYQAKDIAVSEHLVNQVEALVPRHREINYLQALLMANSGQLEEATAHLLESRRDALTPHISIEALLAHTALSTGRNEVALEASKRMTELEPKSSKHWVQQGQIQRNLNQTAPAVRAYETALKIYAKQHPALQVSPTRLPQEPIQAYRALGELYTEQREYAKAIEAFYTVAELYSTLHTSTRALDALAHNVQDVPVVDRLRWACVLSAGRRWAQAQILFDGLDLGIEAPVSSVARYHYALVLRHSGEAEAALAQFHTMPDRAFIPSLAYADTLRVVGQPAAARFEYSKILTLYATSLGERQGEEIRMRMAQLKTP